jgi:hypothetical protein
MSISPTQQQATLVESNAQLRAPCDQCFAGLLACVRARECACLHTCACVCVCMCACARFVCTVGSVVCVHACLPACVRACLFFFLCVCARASACVCVCVLCWLRPPPTTNLKPSPVPPSGCHHPQLPGDLLRRGLQKPPAVHVRHRHSLEVVTVACTNY